MSGLNRRDALKQGALGIAGLTAASRVLRGSATARALELLQLAPGLRVLNVGVGAGGGVTGVVLSGLGVGAGGPIRGLAIAGLGMGAGTGIDGIAVAGLLLLAAAVYDLAGP